MTTKQSPASRRRRWLSFSLRGAFILLTVVCVFCVWLGWQMTRLRQQQAAISKVEELGQPLKFDNQSNVPQWLRTAIGEEYFRKVVTVDFSFGGQGKATDD